MRRIRDHHFMNARIQAGTTPNTTGFSSSTRSKPTPTATRARDVDADQSGQRLVPRIDCMVILAAYGRSPPKSRYLLLSSLFRVITKEDLFMKVRHLVAVLALASLVVALPASAKAP